MPVAKGQHGPSAASDLNMETVTVPYKNDGRLTRIMNALKPRQIKDFKVTGVKVEIPKAVPVSADIADLQVKYAGLLNIIPELLSNVPLLQSIDEWYGTRYRYGGTTKGGIDCSAFVREMFRSVYDVELPRTAREQYGTARRISTTELKEGDLLFFNTTGGVSHVGIYLRNNKFVHSSCSKGVTISDLYENYYISHYIGAGRVEKPDFMASN